MVDAGRILALTGILLLVLGLLFNIMPNWPKIPGDIYINKGPIRIYIPFVSAIVLSVVLTIIFNFFKD